MAHVAERVPDPPGGLSRIGSDPMKLVNDIVDESTNLVTVVLRFAANLVAPEEDEGTLELFFCFYSFSIVLAALLKHFVTL